MKYENKDEKKKFIAKLEAEIKMLAATPNECKEECMSQIEECMIEYVADLKKKEKEEKAIKRKRTLELFYNRFSIYSLVIFLVISVASFITMPFMEWHRLFIIPFSILLLPTIFLCFGKKVN